MVDPRSEPKNTFEDGAPVKTHAKLAAMQWKLIAQENLDARQSGAEGWVTGPIHGYDGIAFWVQHEDAALPAPYFAEELELLPEEHVSSPPERPSQEEAIKAVEIMRAAFNEAEAETRKMRDNWVRAEADFDNFRKRIKREIVEACGTARENLLKELLPVFDNLNRAIQSATQPEGAGPRSPALEMIVSGLALVRRQFDETLEQAGITRVPTVGAFEPRIHEAVQQIEKDASEALPGTILTEVRPGYLHAGRLIRAAMVTVAKASMKANTKEGESS